MARYPNLPFYSNRNNRTKLAEASKEELKDMYETIQRWGNALVEEILDILGWYLGPCSLSLPPLSFAWISFLSGY